MRRGKLARRGGLWVRWLPHEGSRLDRPLRIRPRMPRHPVGMSEISGSSSIDPTGASEAAAVDALRRQVIALQRISSLGVLAGGVFHELNNALTPILNYAKLGLRNPDPAYRERALTQIVDAAQRAATITRGMLGLSRPGDIKHREPTDMTRLVDEVVMLAKKDMMRHRVRLDVKANGKCYARVNPAQIQQVLLNLLINARQAMPGGGVVRLRLGLDTTGRRAEISVADTGVGIAPGRPAAHLRAVFLDQNRTRRRRAGGHGPGPGCLPRHRRSPSWPPPRREPAGPGLDIHHHPARLPAPDRELRRTSRRRERGRGHPV